jgi:hypothetical protein
VNSVTRRLRLVQACVAGIALGSLVAGLSPSRAYKKDLQVEYLTARAWRDGADIFAPIAELSARYFPQPSDAFPHPSPHPPVLVLLSVPLTFLPFPVVVPLWLAANLALLIVVGRWLGFSVRGTLPLAAWPPLWCLLYIGQYELLVLALAMLGWRAAAAGRDHSAGLWFGLAAAIKFYPAFLLVPFLARRRVRLVLLAAAVFGLSQLGNLLAAGPSGFSRYYGEVLPSVSGLYMHLSLNSSPYGALLRLFGGAADVPPLVNAPGIVVPLTVALSAGALLALAKLEPVAAPVALLVGLPSVWFYYVVLALPQIVALLRSPSFRRTTLLATAAASVVLPLVNLLAGWAGSKAPPMAVLLAVQPAGFVALLILSLVKPHASAAWNRKPVVRESSLQPRRVSVGGQRSAEEAFGRVRMTILGRAASAGLRSRRGGDGQ